MSQCHSPSLPTGRHRLSGADAGSFLQGLVTNDIGGAGPGTAIHAGLLSPQGKILFDFFVLADGDGYLLDVASAQADALRQRLGFYRLQGGRDDRRQAVAESGRDLGRGSTCEPACRGAQLP